MTSTRLKVCFFVWLLVTGVGTTTPAMAQLDISDNPLFVAVSVGPNVMFTTDDSGSMTFDYMPDNPLSRQFLGLPYHTDLPNNGEQETGDQVAYLWPYPEIGATGGFSRVYDGRTVPTFKDDIVNAYYRSAAFNSIYYDPTTEYEPWSNWDGTLMDDADPAAAYFDPSDTGDGSINLRTQKTGIEAVYTFEDQNLFDDPETHINPQWPVDVDCDPTEGYSWSTETYDSPDKDDCIETTESFWPMVYWVYDGSGNEFELSSYTKVEIRNGSLYINNAPAGIDTLKALTGTDRTLAEEEQNFANWFQYYRARVLVSRGGIGKAFLSLNSESRVGFARINKGRSEVDGEDHHSIVDGVREFDDAGRENFYDSLYTHRVGGGTPLRSAAIDVGEYFRRDDERGPWSNTPGQAGGGDLLACRQSYHILLTDGYYSGENIDVGNSDGTGGTAIDNPEGGTYVYSPTSPFSDDQSNTLGDIAMEYWKTDLIDIDNRVPTNEVDTAFWQHLTSFGVGFGVDTEQVDPEAAFAAIASGANIDWPEVNFGDREDPAKIDDLLHFAVNGRGGYFSASKPDEFANELAAILSEVIARANATTSVAVSATRLTTESLVYAASFDSNDWSGEIAALNAETGQIEHLATDRLEELTAGGRNIFTYDPSTDSGIAFDGSAVDAIGDRLITNDTPTGPDWAAEFLIDYLRGDDTLEEINGGSFRDRDVMLGDIVNSRPFYSGSGNEGWGRLDEDYLTYIEEDKNDPDRCDDVPSPCEYAREDTLFIGANDGMLHAFDAETMEEFFAYVPAASHNDLHNLARPDYAHQFFVDGQVAVADAKENGNWGTYLVGTMGAGGRGIFALDVTDPENFGAGNVKWEFTAEDDADLGYTFGEPVITRIGSENSGRWVAVFGNGYNSQDGQAYLYIVDLFEGPDEYMQKIALGEAGGNGLSGVAGWRDPATRTRLSRVYAGDLNGTIWRIDFDGTDGSVVYDEGLFTDPDGRAITATPNIAASPAGGLIVYVGTGKLIEDSDRLSASMDRFYAIRDTDEAVGSNFNNNGLAEVVIDEASPVDGQPPLRTVESDGIGDSGWYMELAVGNTSNGERTLSKPRVVFGTVILSTYQPVEDPCRPGGVQRTYVLDALSGSGSLPYCANCGAVEVGTGAPFSPPVTIRQRAPGSVGDVTFPGNQDPSEPTDPGDFPGAPPADGGEPQGWCSEFGIPPLFENGSFLPLGTICEGRQVWREAR